MKRRRLAGAVLVAVIRVTVATAAIAQEASARPSVAIADVAITPGGWTLPPPQMSATIIELMMSELVESRRFHLYDGQWLVPESAAGHIPDLDRLREAAAERGVDYLVLGSLTAFSTEDKKKGYGAVLPTPFLLGGVTKQQAQLHIELTFRMVNVRTGEVVATARGDGIGVRRATNVAAGGVIRGAAPLPVGAFAMSKLPAARDAMLDEALRQAIHNAAVALTTKLSPGASHE